MKLYVWRSPWDGMWYVTREPKPPWPHRHLYGGSFWTHAEAIHHAWALTHPGPRLQPLGDDVYRVTGVMPRSATTGRYTQRH